MVLFHQMTKKQAAILLGLTCSVSVLIGLYSLPNELAGFEAMVIGLVIGYGVGGLVVLIGVLKLIRILVSNQTPPEQKAWTLKRLLIIAVAAIIIFLVNYLQTPR